ncbi:putative LRR receptor-like serine/threonine-protein kinase RKF3 [Prunus yedoensis var. nudiflora]|uniref:non-specific serine/threonine protein kinase n=1 Tax=Prunus yedoensis var. nudiflora TaxID=2094558 RepID=A0A314XM08_PRUYE|nr:putative LRR receptor-like serine/threonine-protein kinase RKF3 [Prunus yedoensis var. nudiflora]
MSLFHFLLLGLVLGFTNSIASSHETSHRKLGNVPCPLNINALQKLIRQNSLPFPKQDIATECQYMVQGMRLIRSEYLRTSGLFSLSPDVLDVCWDSYENLVNEFIPGFDIKSTCGLKTSFNFTDFDVGDCDGLFPWLCWGSYSALVSLDMAQEMEGKKKENLAQMEPFSSVELELCGRNSSSLKFSFEEIRKATGNFSRENIIGMGGFGNVYKGILADGSEVALKRFKNCSAVGDQLFAHEVEVISSVRHVNLVALRGYCISTLPREGHQRILACDLMRNGSLYDHLFQPEFKKLSWSIRQKIALEMARGLAYLHHGVQPAIIHRDIKASNVLLDETFEAKLADFGLAKFTPEGQTHVSTRLAGTLGYVAPEYALYGQICKKIDVYSFGVVLLEILSGKKAVIEFTDENRPLLLADWAWSQVKEGRAFDVIDEGMPELGLPEAMERYVLIAVLASHPVAYARPTMDQIVKILENTIPIPSIPDRPLSLLSHTDDAERSSRSFNGLYLPMQPNRPKM